jgi:hypothetical protein
MCTSVCPCYEYDSASGRSNTIFEGYPGLLEAHDRTFNLTKSEEEMSKYIYMNFTSDKNFSFKSMLDCFDHYEAMTAVNESAMEIFEIDIDLFLEQTPEKLRDDKGIDREVI